MSSRIAVVPVSFDPPSLAGPLRRPAPAGSGVGTAGTEGPRSATFGKPSGTPCRKGGIAWLLRNKRRRSRTVSLQSASFDAVSIGLKLIEFAPASGNRRDEF